MPQFRYFLAISTCLFAICTVSSDASGQVTSSNANISEPTEFPKIGDPQVRVHNSFLDEISPAILGSTTTRFESYDPFGLFLENADIAGELRVYFGSNFDMVGGSVRGLVLENFSNAFIHGGTVEALNPISGLTVVDGGNVNVANYNPSNGASPFPQFSNEPLADTLSRITPLSTPIQDSVIILDSGTLTGNFSLGTGSELVVSGGSVGTTLGDIEGNFVATGGEFTNFSAGAVSGQVDILATDFGVAFSEDRLAVDASNFDGTQPITGTFADGNEFSFDFFDVVNGGTVNLIKDLSEFDITDTQTAGAANGGAEFAGGVDVSFEEVTTDGMFSSNALETEVGELEMVLDNLDEDVDVATPNFEQASEEVVQLWDLGFTGQFNEDATLVFGYDENLLDIPEEELAIYHFDEELGIWESLEILNHNIDTNRIRVRTRNFSPFVLGAAASVPEPSSGVLLIGLGMSFMASRRRRI